MKFINMNKRIFKGLIIFAIMSSLANAGQCDTRLFSVTADSSLTIGDMVDNLADTCGLSVIVKDEAAKLRMNKKLYYVKLKNATMRTFLNTVLKDNDLHYSIEGNKLTIAYLITKTFRVHYIAGNRIGKSNAGVTIIAGSSESSSSSSGGGSATNVGGGSSANTGISIESNNEFLFWKNIGDEIQRILISAGDGSTHFAKTSDKSWVGPDGQVWEYNPVAPIVNPEAGMITVTGTPAQIEKVAKYIDTLSTQIKKQVMIDVRIMSVNFDDSKTTGIDWSQIYNLQSLSVNSTLEAARNIYPTKITEGIVTEWARDEKSNPAGASVFATGKVEVSDIVRFLGTQGNVKNISSPRVMTLNNQPALISVGKELFYKITTASTSASGGGSTSATGETVDSVFAGILLDITPEIDDNGMITLKINPSISDTVNSTVSGDGTRKMPPDLVRRQLASVIKVKDGEHAILGGLISSKEGIESSKVPILGDIPIISYAFKKEVNTKTTEELVLIITPHIIETPKDALMKDLGYSILNEK
ncbi:General secretory pathway protein D [Sulfurovum sp. enrichment culture clone C5]|uniref:General secretory pathway protein D n=1 Tax=Sulfurovum sp. enrichment culture clone C5 TaxID=497650 RepID=A0A0S4XRB0_9BACT|nr:General secretory pathway protein D [Sulfurovum sp. enrichment culture clone C5]